MSNNELNYGGYVGGYFFNPIRRDISMIKGDTMSFGFQVQGLEGQDPEGVELICKKTLEDESTLFEISLADNIDKRSYDEETDTITYTVRIPPRLTEDLDAGRYFYDLKIYVDTDVISLMVGRINIEEGC